MNSLRQLTVAFEVITLRNFLNKIAKATLIVDGHIHLVQCAFSACINGSKYLYMGRQEMGQRNGPS